MHVSKLVTLSFPEGTAVIAPVISRYSVCPLPEDSDWYSVFEITVERMRQRTGEVLWAVRRHQMCVNAAGDWGYESRPSEREDDWLADNRHDLETALRLAQEASGRLRINGKTIADILADRETGSGR